MRNVGAMLMGLGMLFIGMGQMGDATSPLRTHQPFIDLMQSMDNRFLAILVGAVFTALVQSSSATIGIVIYTVSMWVAGLMEGLQWRALNDAGQLANPIFLDIVNRLMPYYWMRLLGGSLYLIGMLMFVFNLLKTIAGSGQATSKETPTPAPAA